MNRIQLIEYLTGKVPEDEPVFALRARDMFAPAVIRVWTTLCHASNNKAARTKAAEVEKFIDEMTAWQERNGKKVPD